MVLCLQGLRVEVTPSVKLRLILLYPDIRHRMHLLPDLVASVASTCRVL